MTDASTVWNTDVPTVQSYWAFDGSRNAWVRHRPSPAPASDAPGSRRDGFTRLALYSWNIDFMLPLAEPRMTAAMQTLHDITDQLPPTTAAVIFLQENVKKDLVLISRLPWVRDNYYMTDVSVSNWETHYGTVTLVDRRVPVASCFRVHYNKSGMGRDGLFVDLLLGANADKRIRLCNTHLESLAYMPSARPPQMRVVSEHMRADGIHGAAVAGDFNAIQYFDLTLHIDNGLKDAYLELGGLEDTEEGYTWGQQARTASRQRFGCSRMDKVFFSGGLVLNKFERFGAGVKLDGEQGEELMSNGLDEPWVTDHLGVMAEFQIE